MARDSMKGAKTLDLPQPALGILHMRERIEDNPWCPPGQIQGHPLVIPFSCLTNNKKLSTWPRLCYWSHTVLGMTSMVSGERKSRFLLRFSALQKQRLASNKNQGQNRGHE